MMPETIVALTARVVSAEYQQAQAEMERDAPRAQVAHLQQERDELERVVADLRGTHCEWHG